MGHYACTSYYKKEVLFGVISILLPNDSYVWAEVAHTYKERYGEAVTSDKVDIKCHCVEKMCKEFNMSTGKSKDDGDFILHCQRVPLQIHKKCELALMGTQSNEDHDSGSKVGDKKME